MLVTSHSFLLKKIVEKNKKNLKKHWKNITHSEISNERVFPSVFIYKYTTFSFSFFNCLPEFSINHYFNELRTKRKQKKIFFVSIRAEKGIFNRQFIIPAWNMKLFWLISLTVTIHHTFFFVEAQKSNNLHIDEKKNCSRVFLLIFCELSNWKSWSIEMKHFFFAFWIRDGNYIHFLTNKTLLCVYLSISSLKYL